MLNLSTLIHPVIQIGRKAAKVILEVYNESQALKVHTKLDNSPLTKADLAANAIITKGLSQLSPSLPVLSEEGMHPSWGERKHWETYWLIDPLDGTRPFIEGQNEFTVNIALIHHHNAVLGIVAPPATGECYFAYSGNGAHKIDASEKIQQINIRPWQPNQTKILTSQAAKASVIHKKFKHLGEYTTQKMSSSWKFCLLAEGKADLCPRFGDTSEWDTAAGHCILKEAGGDILNLDGKPLQYNTKTSLLNPHFIAIGDIESLKSKMF